MEDNEQTISYSGVGVYIRADEQRFTTLGPDGEELFNPDAVNQAGVRIVTIDGGTSNYIARNDYPNAEHITLPQLTDIEQKFRMLVSEGADLLFAEPYFGQEYLRSNPDSVRDILDRTAAANGMTSDAHCRFMVTRGVKVKPFQHPSLSR